LDDADAVVEADAVRIVQVLSNLLVNAAKYTPDGGRISVSTARTGGHVEIAVADTGAGIPREDQARVFEMFAQLPHTQALAKGGLGIGLALARRLVEMHGGSIGVESAGVGLGSRFVVRLPLAEAAQDGGVTGSDEPAIQASRPLRIAVVEDNEDGRRMLVDILRMRGHSVEWAGDGAQGWALVQRSRPELVLLDLGLPGLDGIEVCRRIRADAATASTPVVALTGWGTDVDRARTRQAGFDAHLTKPVDVRELLARIDAVAGALTRS
jgi:CheY-like chemotaxis protein